MYIYLIFDFLAFYFFQLSPIPVHKLKIGQMAKRFILALRQMLK